MRNLSEVKVDVRAVRKSCTARSPKVKLKDFEEHYSRMYLSSRFTPEFELIVATSPRSPTSTSRRPKNQDKNRYVNILPFDHSRVKLSVPPEDKTASDYVNANFIPGNMHHREYIACQGPLPHTVVDFWRTIWDYNCRTIVMVTQVAEGGMVKCEQYWPDKGRMLRFDDIIVRTTKEEVFDVYVNRTFQLKRYDEFREVKHLHFMQWGDYSCPSEPRLLVEFVIVVRANMTPHTGPVVVHCSAGVGRTGTFIAVDRLMQHLRTHDYVDIYGLVEEMRHYRTSMVQTEGQYVYVHDCVLYILNNMEVLEKVAPKQEVRTRRAGTGTMTPVVVSPKQQSRPSRVSATFRTSRFSSTSRPSRVSTTAPPPPQSSPAKKIKAKQPPALSTSRQSSATNQPSVTGQASVTRQASLTRLAARRASRRAAIQDSATRLASAAKQASTASVSTVVTFPPSVMASEASVSSESAKSEESQSRSDVSSIASVRTDEKLPKPKAFFGCLKYGCCGLFAFTLVLNIKVWQ